MLLVSPSFSLLSPRSLILPTGPSLCPSFCPPPLRAYFSVSSPRFSSSRLQRMLARAATDLAPPDEMCQGLAIWCAARALLRTHTHRLSSFSLLFPRGATGEEHRVGRTAVFNRPFRSRCARSAEIGIADSRRSSRFFRESVMEFARGKRERFIRASTREFALFRGKPRTEATAKACTRFLRFARRRRRWCYRRISRVARNHEISRLLLSPDPRSLFS